MTKLLILTAILFLASCDVAQDAPTPSTSSTTQPRGEASPNQSLGVDVKVTKNDGTLAAFQVASDATGVGALLSKDDLSIELTSPGQLWVLSISVSDTKPGVYSLAALREAGKAMIILTGGDGEAMMVRAHNGELKLEQLTDNYWSGSFNGTGTDATGNKYTYEGKFSRVKARTVE